MKQNLILALDDFYFKAGLRVRCKDSLPYNEEDLYWGIDQLIKRSAPVENYTKAHQVLIGAADPLIDASIIANQCSFTQIIPAATHRLAELLPQLEIS